MKPAREMASGPNRRNESSLLIVPAPCPESEEPQLADKVAFLRNPESYPGLTGDVVTHETHMSWVFLAGTTALKLKKPVRFPYLDFSTLARREAACRAELRLNRRLARTVYLDVAPLLWSDRGFSIGGHGTVVDWLVVMRRLDHDRMLDRAIDEARVEGAAIDRLAEKLIRFYRSAGRPLIPAESGMAEWRRDIAINYRILLDPRFGLPPGIIRRIDRIQRHFLEGRRKLLDGRVTGRFIVDGHGDLRPEHIWLGEHPQIIDCLEFNARLRAVDPFDEIAYLSVECERLGAGWVGERIRRRLAGALHDGVPEELYRFYRCYRATLRARLAIAHLAESQPRTPEKWPRLARDYLRIAASDAERIERLLRRPGDRPNRVHHASGGLCPQATRP